jgi:hypothetical protein
LIELRFSDSVRHGADVAISVIYLKSLFVTKCYADALLAHPRNFLILLVYSSEVSWPADEGMPVFQASPLLQVSETLVPPNQARPAVAGRMVQGPLASLTAPVPVLPVYSSEDPAFVVVLAQFWRGPSLSSARTK